MAENNTSHTNRRLVILVFLLMFVGLVIIGLVWYARRQCKMHNSNNNNNSNNGNCSCVNKTRPTWTSLVARMMTDQRPEQNIVTPMQQVHILHHNDPKLLVIEQFCTADECNHLIKLAEQNKFDRSTVQGEKQEVSQHRTSYTTNLNRAHDDVVARIEQRVAALSGFPLHNIEQLQVVRYEPGQQYKHHYDFFVPDTTGTPLALQNGGQRCITIFVYLNDLDPTETGGQTDFPKLKVQVKPKQGRAVYWTNVKPDGQEDYQTFHAGLPPTKSIKYGLNIWIREATFQ
jgi:prolyl 4-hydroxylase